MWPTIRPLHTFGKGKTELIGYADMIKIYISRRVLYWFKNFLIAKWYQCSLRLLDWMFHFLCFLIINRDYVRHHQCSATWISSLEKTSYQTDYSTELTLVSQKLETTFDSDGSVDLLQKTNLAKAQCKHLVAHCKVVHLVVVEYTEPHEVVGQD